MPKGLYSGSFDPFTLGHLDIVRKAADIFCDVRVLVAVNSEKKSLIPPTRRVDLILQCDLPPNVGVDVSSGLVVDYAKSHGYTHLIRGIRDVGDMISELRLADINKRIGRLETVFVISGLDRRIISSSLVKDIMANRGDFAAFVPAPVYYFLKNKGDI